MSIARMTLMGMQDYLYETQRKNLNDSWTLESTVLTFDKDVLLDTIMLDGGQLGINTTNPDQFYRQCAMFWSKWKYTFQKWWEVAETEYHWEWNTEWWEDGTNKETGSGTKDGTNSETQVIDDDSTYGKSGNSTNQASGSDKSEHEASRSIGVTNTVSAFDSSSYQPDSRSDTDDDLTKDDTTTTYGRKDTTNWSENGTGTDDKTITTNGTTGEETTSSKDASHDIYKRGNIGVMSTQQLERETMETKFHYNPYNLMSAVFIKEMTCAVW